jgi:hypothetical protein
MPDTNEIEFLEPVRSQGGKPSRDGRPGSQSLAVRIGIVAGSALLVLVGVAAAMGASSAPTTTAAAPGAGTVPGTPGTNPRGQAFGMGGGRFGAVGFNDIKITSISGSNLGLATADGWTRTITATSATTITKGAATITVADLKVGDQVTFSQAKQTDGSYTITAIRVILPSIGGQVTAVGGNTITVTQRDGTAATIHVDATTTYQVQGVTSPTLSDVKVGAYIVAQGSLRTDGSLDASVVSSGFRGGFGNGGGWGPGRGGHGPGFPDKDAAPGASPSATATPG